MALIVASFGLLGLLDGGVHPADAVIETTRATAAHFDRSSPPARPALTRFSPAATSRRPTASRILSPSPASPATRPDAPAADPAPHSAPSPHPGPSSPAQTPTPPVTARPDPGPISPPAPLKTTSPSAPGFGCDSALAYLASHAAPGFTFECPGYAVGHQAMTCVNVTGVCAGQHLIAIAVPCPSAYENEASNSWVLLGLRHAPIDPYGACS